MSQEKTGRTETFIDLRSDTVTVPTDAMLDAMRQAVVGDDVYGDDPTVNRLEKESALRMGKESALFVPSGTFANQLAILTHTLRGDEVIIPESNHIVQHEVGSAAVISSVQLRTLPDRYGMVDPDQIRIRIREEDIHHPRTGLLALENAHSAGRAIPLVPLEDMARTANTAGIPVHLDGARIFNAAHALGVETPRIARCADSVMFCLSKGLCCPVGSMLAGNASFIERARKMRKLMGGGMRQAGYLAAAGLVALDTMVDRLNEDHENAQFLAHLLGSFEAIEIQHEQLDINMVFFSLQEHRCSPSKLVEYLFSRGIKINPPMDGLFRLVTHHGIQRKDIEYVFSLFVEFFS